MTKLFNKVMWTIKFAFLRLKKFIDVILNEVYDFLHNYLELGSILQFQEYRKELKLEYKKVLPSIKLINFLAKLEAHFLIKFLIVTRGTCLKM